MTAVDDARIPERFWEEARDIVFQKYHAIQMLYDDKLDRAFNWPPDALVSAIAAKLAAEAQLRQEREARTEWAGIAGTHAGSIELLQAQVSQLQATNAQLREVAHALQSLKYQAAGYAWGQYGTYRGKQIVLSESMLESIDALLAKVGEIA